MFCCSAKDETEGLSLGELRERRSAGSLFGPLYVFCQWRKYGGTPVIAVIIVIVRTT